ncbi:integrase [Pseudomonas sp. W4I3]|nr:integrase [Pseudomonas sp. W4I3]
MADGVEARGNSVRVYFRFNGELCRELVPGGNTPENREHAKRLVTVIEYEIQAGTFDYRRHFPESAKLAENTFGHYLDLWLTIKSNSVAATSFRGYKNKAEVHVRPRWGDVQIDQIDHLDLQEWIQGPLSKRLKNKTIRDIISNVRQVFRLYRTRKKVAHDPTEGLFVRLPDPEAPDPFTRAEIKQILNTHTSRTQELLMVQFMIWAGPRVSETIALAWEDVDLKQGTVTFRRSKVRGAYRVTKTRRSTRKVRLLEPAWDALRKLDAINQPKTVDTVDVVERDNKTVRKHKLHFVFLNTKSGLPHVRDFVVRDRFFKAHLKAAGVRYRGPGQCRPHLCQSVVDDWRGLGGLDRRADGAHQRKHDPTALRNVDKRRRSRRGRHATNSIEPSTH